MKRTLLAIAAAVLLPVAAPAQTDADGCKDHPLLTRLENFYVSSCEENFNALTLRTGGSTSESKEGTLFRLYYRYNFDNGAKAKSALQIIRNYELALQKNGGKLLYRNVSGMEGTVEATLYLSTKEKEYWVQLTSFAGTDNAVEAYALNVLEVEAMKQEVAASQMFEAISKAGFIALYINFETGKSTILPESQEIVTQIADMLRENPSLQVSVEGHTDNIGTAKANQLLSQARAAAVMNAVIAKGIARTRLSAKGWGQTKPVADNATADGRGKNRRVEIVKR
jgi:OOP family OmpA-OmpF porin